MSTPQERQPARSVESPAPARPSEDSGSAAGAGADQNDSYRELFERSADAILIIEGETFIDCNDATVRMLRYRNRAQLLETHPSELSPPRQPDGRDSREKASEMIALAFEHGSHRFEWEHLRADGEVFPVEVLLTSVKAEGREVLHVVWRDIAERKRLELELRQAQRNEAIGRLAAGIAHDFNNLLVVIVGNADLLQVEIAGRARASEHVAEIQQAAERAAELVRQLLAFGRAEESRPRVLELNAMIAGVEGLLRRLIGEDIELETQFESEPLSVRADGGQLEQVLFNLAANARDAMPRGGALTLRAQLSGDPRSDLAGAGAGSSHVLLTVRDTGSGMSAHEIEHAFDPFFTTKEVGQGTGLGLATVFGIVKQAGGHVSIESTPGRGTVISVYLPRCADAPSEPEFRELDASETGGTETLLVVEDEPSVATLVHRVLARDGYEVLSARNGREAYELYLRRAADIDLIVTDLIMPEMSGVELVSSLRDAGHTPRVLFLSGYTDSQLARLETLGDETDLLRKPFKAGDLTRRVRQALARS